MSAIKTRPHDGDVTSALDVGSTRFQTRRVCLVPLSFLLSSDRLILYSNYTPVYYTRSAI